MGKPELIIYHSFFGDKEKCLEAGSQPGSQIRASSCLAITKAASEKGFSLYKVDAFQALMGQGIPENLRVLATILAMLN